MRKKIDKFNLKYYNIDRVPNILNWRLIIISYIGGKKFHVKYITPHFPTKFDGYCEPFSGAFWVYLQSGLTKNQVIYNDLNPNMVNLFKSCTSNPSKMKDIMKSLPPQDADLFIKFRDEIFNRGFNNPINMPNFDLAAKFAYIQTQIFAGNTLSEKSKITILDKKYRSKFEHFIDKLSNNKILRSLSGISSFENLDFEDCIKKYDREGMLFYIDPPYFDCEDYYTIGKKDIHERLSKCVSSIKGYAIISYYMFEQIKNWYDPNKFNFVTYNINCQNGNRLKEHSSKRQEILIKNF